MSQSAPINYRYKDVYALLLYWEDDDMDALKEANPLFDVFRGSYNFHTEYYQIPSQDPEEELESRFRTRYKSLLSSTDILFIIYYTGHGGQVQSGLIWGLGSESGPYLNWSRIQRKHIDPAACDTILLLDCCYAAAAFPPNPVPPIGSSSSSPHLVEILASCAAGKRCPAPGRRSFSHSLIKELKARAGSGAPSTVSELTQALGGRLARQNQKWWIWERKSEQPVFARAVEDNGRSIELRLMPSREKEEGEWTE